jgi:hypothetical protein
MEKDMKKRKPDSRNRKTTRAKDLPARPGGAAGVKGGGINRIVVTDGKISAKITS